jgi:hypothetical protein
MLEQGVAEKATVTQKHPCDHLSKRRKDISRRSHDEHEVRGGSEIY